MQGSRFVLEPCGFSPASAGLENATAGSVASRSTKGALQRSLALTPTASPTLGDLSQRACELWKVPFESSPALAGMELTVSSLPCESPEALREKRQRSLALTPPASPTLSVFPCESPEALREKRQRSLALTPTPAATLGNLSQRACELRKVPFESSPALAGMELTVSSLPCESPCGSSGRMAFFPGFSWLGKCDSRCGKPPTLMLQQATACLLSVLPCGSPLALQFSA